MSIELISVLVAVLAIGATLAGLILTSNVVFQQQSGRYSAYKLMEEACSALDEAAGEDEN